MPTKSSSSETKNTTETAKLRAGGVPSGILPTDQLAVVEKDSPDSGYLLTKSGGFNDTRYLVREGSALTGPPWNMDPGTLQGAYANPPLSDELLKELGLSREDAEKSGETLEVKDALEGAEPTPDDFDPDEEKAEGSRDTDHTDVDSTKTPATTTQKK